MLHNLLNSPLLTWRDPGRHRGATTLPGILSHLATGELGDFPRLRTHQLHPWCMFLTQLAAIALHRAGQTDPRLDEDAWRELLLALTAGRHEPWCLVVEDLEQPAFFQPPVPEGTMDDHWKAQVSPDDIDVLATAKAHDVKMSLVPSDDVEAWAYALVTLQTIQGVYGAGKYGVARMNGGYGSRCRVGYSPDATLSARFRRDVGVLLEFWPDQLARGYRDDGVALVWTERWDGTGAFSIGDLAPYFIEICRRVRLVADDHGLAFRGTTSRGRRCLTEIRGGDVGDPWIPIARDKGTALSVTGRGFHYELLVRLLFESEFAPPPTQHLRNEDPDPLLFVAAGLARGEGGTEGLHERVLVLAGPIRWRLGKPDTRAPVGRRAGDRVASAQTMRSKVLYPALKQLGAVAEDEFDACVDKVFFDHLFSTLDDADEDARLAWERLLRDMAQTELQRAISRSALPSARRFKVTSAAEGMFAGCLRKNFPDLQSPQEAQGVSS